MQSEQPEAVRLAYVISAFKLPRNLIRLTKRLAADGETVAIHVDKRTSSAVYEEMTAGLEGLPNVHFLERHRSPYAGYGHVRTSLKGLALLRRLAIPYDFAVLLTGQDYPIKPLKSIRATLAPHRGQTFMEHFPMPADCWETGGMTRLSRWHFSTPHGLHGVRRQLLRPFVPQQLPYGLAPYGGSGYWTMWRDHVDYVLDFVNNHPKYERFFRRAAVPDEIFFQTILMNSPHASELVGTELHYIDWERTEDIPAVFDTSDLETLIGRPEPFARKFDSSRDDAVLDALDRIGEETPSRLTSMPEPSLGAEPGPALRVYRPVKRRLELRQIWSTREVAKMIGLRDLKVKYKQAALGPLWLLIGPLGMLAAVGIAFAGVTQVDTQGVPYILFALVGLVVWSYIQLSLSIGASAIVGNAALVRRSAMPRIALITGTLLGNLPPVVVMLAMTLVGTVIWGGLSLQILLLPVVIAWAVLFTFSVTLLVASVAARFRDTLSVMPLLIQAGIFVTPVGYPLQGAPHNIKLLLSLNPVSGIIEAWRWVILDMPNTNVEIIAIAAALTVVLAVAGWIIFSRLEVTFADVV